MTTTASDRITNLQTVLPSFMRYVPEHKAVICTDPLHGYALVEETLPNHIRDHHQSIGAERRRAIVAAMRAMGDKLHKRKEDFLFPQQPIPIIVGVKVVKNCYKCIHCSCIVGKANAEKSMRRHLRTAHQINTYAYRGNPTLGARRLATTAWEENTRMVIAQRFFASGSEDCVRYFEVFEGSTTKQDNQTPFEKSQSTDTKGNARLAAPHMDPETLNSILEKAQSTRKQVLAENKTFIPQEKARQASSWITKARFLTALGQDLTFPEAANLVAQPDQRTEPKAFILWEAVSHMLTVYQETVINAPTWARLTVMQEYKGNRVTQPLTPYDGMSKNHYHSLQRIFMFMCRVFNNTKAPAAWNPTPHLQDQWSTIETWLLGKTLSDVLEELHQERPPCTLHPLAQLCHTFWISLLSDEVSWDDYDMALLNGLAALATKPDGFVKPGSLANDISGLKKMARFGFVYKIYDEIGRNSKRNEDYTLAYESSSVKQQHAPTVLSNWTELYLSGSNVGTPFGWMSSLNQFISVLAYDDTMEGFVSWNGSTLTCRDTTITMDEYRSIIHTLYDRAEKLLLELLFTENVADLPQVPWKDLRDQPSNSEPGWCLFDSSINKCLAIGDNYVGKRLIAIINSDGAIPVEWAKTWNPESPAMKERYSDKVEEFLEIMLALVHLTYGQPTRATELLSVHHTNTSLNQHRNLFIIRLLLALVPQWHKCLWQEKKPQLVYHFLPEPVGNLLAWYLWLVLPYFQGLHASVPTEERGKHYFRAYSTLIWSDIDGCQYTEGSLLRKVLVQATESTIGRPISILRFRHIIIAIGRRILGKDCFRECIDENDINAMFYEKEGEVLELKGGHSVETARSAYARDVERVFNVSFHRVDAHYRESVRYHNFEHWPRRNVLDTESLTEQQEQPDTTAHAKERRSINLQDTLKEMYGPNATFRGKQEQVLDTTLRNESPIIYIAGTGSGKSLTFLLPASQAVYRQVIVVVPLVALRFDIVRKCRENGIHCVEWEPLRHPDSADIVLVMPEHIEHEAFVGYTKRMYTGGRLERIVLDEGHFAFLPNQDHRPALQNLRRLTTTGIPLTILTATLPPTWEDMAWTALGIEQAHRHLFRESSRRPNIHYEVEEWDNHSEIGINVLAEYIKNVYHKLEDPGKVVVFIPSRGTVRAVADTINCPCFHGKLSDMEKRAITRQFAATAHGIIIATSAFGHGYDDAEVVFVLHIGSPDNLVMFSQESGRGGRKGQTAISRILIAPGLPSHVEKQPYREQKSMDKFLQSGLYRRRCRRRVLDEYLDGDQDPPACQTHEAACDVCKGEQDESGFRSTASAIAKQSMQTQKAGTRDDQSTCSTATSRETEPEIPVVINRGLRSPSIDPNWMDAVIVSPKKTRMAPDKELLTEGKETPTQHEAQATEERYTADSTMTRQETNANEMARSGTAKRGRSKSQDREIARDERRQERERAQAVRDHQKRVQDASDLLQTRIPRMMEFWEENCAICMLKQDLKGYRHRRNECEQMTGNDTKEMKKKLDFGRVARQTKQQSGPNEGFCFGCFMPWSLCGKWEASRIDGAGFWKWQMRKDQSCRWPRQLADIWAALWKYRGDFQNELSTKAEAKGLNLRDPADFAKHYEATEVIGNHRLPNTVLDVLHVTERHFS